jgi:hypothetical protein
VSPAPPFPPAIDSGTSPRTKGHGWTLPLNPTYGVCHRRNGKKKIERKKQNNSSFFSSMFFVFFVVQFFASAAWHRA